MLKILLFTILLTSVEILSSASATAAISIADMSSPNTVMNSHHLQLVDSIQNTPKITKKKKRTTGHKILVGAGITVGAIGLSTLLMATLLALHIIHLP